MCRRKAMQALASIRLCSWNRQRSSDLATSFSNFRLQPPRYSSRIKAEIKSMADNSTKKMKESNRAIKIVEVGPRDGLQNEGLPLVSTRDKLELIRMLERAGCSNIEVGAFVSPKWIPQMAGSSNVLHSLMLEDLQDNFRRKSISNMSNTRPRYSILVPNLKGLESALSAGGSSRRTERGIIDEISIFGSASEDFTTRNINSTIDESMNKFQAITDLVQEAQDSRASANDSPILIRGYVSTVIACPYSGLIKPKEVAYAVERMLSLGCHEVSLGDTIGVGTPLSTKRMLDEVLNVAKPSELAMHCHDTYGRALVNILVGLEKEIYTIDSSVAGLGGCPYAKGASGNVATEDVITMLHGMGLSTGISLEKLLDAGQFIGKVLDRRTKER